MKIKSIIFILMFSYSSQSLTALNRLLPLESILYIGLMEKKEFEQLYPGSDFEQPSVFLSDGFYLVYEHEALKYFFGPSEDQFTCDRYKEKLDEVVDAVQKKRQSLNSAKTYILKFPDEQIELPGNLNKNPDNQSKPKIEHSEKEVNSPSPIIPFWRRVMELFGL
jgi:hypothetical protein